MINSELCRFVLPGTLVLAHESKVKGSDVEHTKSDFAVVKGMLQKQLIVWSPLTKQERKIDSYTTIEGPRGYHWRDQLEVEYVAPRACKPLPGDFDINLQARRSKQMVELIMPESMKQQLKTVKMPRTLSIVKHVQDEGTTLIRPPDVEHVREMIENLKQQRDSEAGGTPPEKDQ